MEKDEQKKIDETWKETVEKERTQQTEKAPADARYFEPTFETFISSLGLQTLILLGEVANPITGKKEKNLGQARFVIDTLGMLKEKTKGNLTTDEAAILDDVLYDLRTRYVNATKT